MHNLPSNHIPNEHEQAGSHLSQATLSAPGLVVTIPSYELEALMLAKGAEIAWEAPSLVVFSEQVSSTHVVYPLRSSYRMDETSFFNPLTTRVIKLNGREVVLPLDRAMAAAAHYEGRSVIFDWEARRCLETCFSSPVQDINLGSVEGQRQLQRILGSTLLCTLPQARELKFKVSQQAQGIVCQDSAGILAAVNAFALMETHRDLSLQQLTRLYSILSNQKLSPNSQTSTAHLLNASMVVTPQTVELVHEFASRIGHGQQVRTEYEYSAHTPFRKVFIGPSSSASVSSDVPFPHTLTFWKDGQQRDLNIAEHFGMKLRHHAVVVTATLESPQPGTLLLLDLEKTIPGLAQRDLRIRSLSALDTKGTLEKEPCSFGGVPAFLTLQVSQKIAPTREEPLSAGHYVGLGSSLKALLSPRTADSLKVEVVIEFQEAWDDYLGEPHRYYQAVNAAARHAQESMMNPSTDRDTIYSGQDNLSSCLGDEVPVEMVLWPEARCTPTRKWIDSELPEQSVAAATVSLATVLARPTKGGAIDIVSQAQYVRQYSLRRDEVASSARSGDPTSLTILFYLAEDGGQLSRWSKKLLVDIVNGPTSSQFSVDSAELILEKIDSLPEGTRSFLFEHLLAAPNLTTWRPEPPGPWVTLLRDEVMRQACVALLERSQILKSKETEQLVALLALTLPHPDVARGFFRILRSSPGGEIYRLRDRLLADQLSALKRGGTIFTSIEQPAIEHGTYALFLPGLDIPIALDRNLNGYEYTGILSLEFDEQGSCTTPGFRTSRPLAKSDCTGDESLPSLYLISESGLSVPFPFQITEVAEIPSSEEQASRVFVARCHVSINTDWWNRDRKHPSPLLRGALIQRDLSSWGDAFPALHPQSGIQLFSSMPPLLLEEMEWRSSPTGERSRYGTRYEAVLRAWQEGARHVPSFNPAGPLVKGIQDVYRYPAAQLAALRSTLMSPLHLHFAQEELTLVTAATAFHLRFLPDYFSVDERTLYERLLNESIVCADFLLQQGAASGMTRMMKFDTHLQVLRLQSAPYWHDEFSGEGHPAYIEFIDEVSTSMSNNSLRNSLEAERLRNLFLELTSFEQLAALKIISDPLFSALYSSSGVSPRLSQYYADRQTYLLSLMGPLSTRVSGQAYCNPYDEAFVELIRTFALSDDDVGLAFPSLILQV